MTRAEIVVAAGVALFAWTLFAEAEEYYIRRGGLDNARVHLMADRPEYKGMTFAAYENSWWMRGTLTDYPKQIEDALKLLYGVSPRCDKTGYPGDLWLAQCSPGGRVGAAHTVVWDSNILKDAVRGDPETAARQFEVIVRQAMAYDPKQSWLVVHGDDPLVVAEYKSGRDPITVRVAEKVAEQ